MSEIRWLAPAERAAFRLPARARRDLLETLRLLRDNPEMFRVVEGGRYRGRRRAPIGSNWILYYRVVSAEGTIYLDDIRDARRRPV